MVLVGMDWVKRNLRPRLSLLLFLLLQALLTIFMPIYYLWQAIWWDCSLLPRSGTPLQGLQVSRF